ncbi:MAG: hypothetical protein EOP56_10875 [Sphingobacteriales bacterium]|nr:MAG: hypothetical protein EOP56_10875 [Sphingobacteriales bacterium]
MVISRLSTSVQKFMLTTALCALAGSATPIYGQQQGEIIYSNDFSVRKKDLRRDGFKGKYNIQDAEGSKVIHIQSKSTKKQTISLPLDINQIRGKTISVRARVKAENVTEPEYAYNGIKMMLQSRLPWETRYPQAELPRGSFSWRNVSFKTFIPTETEECNLVLGLEQSLGDVWFDNLEIRADGVLQKAQPATMITPAYKGHSLPRLRGAMIPPLATADDLKTLSSWGANLVRWQLTWSGFPRSYADTATVASYTKWLNGLLDHVETMMPLCRQLGLKVVLDLHTLPGGVTDARVSGSDMRLFKDVAWQQTFLNIWATIAERFKNEPAIWGYDLANEPSEGVVPDGVMTWQQLATAAAQAIRNIDTTHTIIVEGNIGAEPIGLNMLTPIPVKGVVYSIHMYNPFEFTHQAIWDNQPAKISYPGTIDGRVWDKQMLRRFLQMTRDWQYTHNAHIFVGEFGAIRWAPNESAYNYLKECIELFEEYGWDWTYHAFREFDGWSVEHTTDRTNTNRSEPPTKRQQLMMDWFGKNQKP